MPGKYEEVVVEAAVARFLSSFVSQRATFTLRMLKHAAPELRKLPPRSVSRAVRVSLERGVADLRGRKWVLLAFHPRSKRARACYKAVVLR